MEETALAVSTEPTIHLVARNPQEMALAKSSLESWLREKVRQCDRETDDLGQAAEIAVRKGWGHNALYRHTNLAKKRADFYRKALHAVEAGYTIVPNFPIDLFAIRVKRELPKRDSSVSNYSVAHAMRNSADLKPQVLIEGEGRYVSPQPIGRSGDYPEKDSSGKEITKYFFSTTDFQEVQFPIQAAQPEVMDATAEAMALKVFDAVGICPQSRRGDPLIIGKILAPKASYQQKEISFLIAWHLDLRTL